MPMAHAVEIQLDLKAFRNLRVSESACCGHFATKETEIADAGANFRHVLRI
jgi:hypothetical protein